MQKTEFIIPPDFTLGCVGEELVGKKKSCCKKYKKKGKFCGKCPKK